MLEDTPHDIVKKKINIIKKLPLALNTKQTRQTKQTQITFNENKIDSKIVDSILESKIESNIDSKIQINSKIQIDSNISKIDSNISKIQTDSKIESKIKTPLKTESKTQTGSKIKTAPKIESKINTDSMINTDSEIEIDSMIKTDSMIKIDSMIKTDSKIINANKKSAPVLVNNKEQWTILSFDIGVKNLAYCMMNYEKGTLKRNILYWNVINLFPESETHACVGIKTNGDICGKTASFQYKLPKSLIEDIHSIPIKTYCKTHLPNKEQAMPIKLREISKISNQELNLALVKELTKMPFLLDCDEIVLEHQPSKSPRMKNLSFMIYSYFIIRGFVDFPSSKLKLIQFRQINTEKKLSLYDGPPILCTLKQKYDQNKYYSKAYCEYLIRDDKNWLDFYNGHKKKDDLADCFLQGAYYLNFYLKNKKPIPTK